jgi:NAD(P)-dependent dehydrogenase (short-subunit alcohol dehydrogenase family)
MFDVAGLASVVTGAASGIGLAYAEIMAECNARVTLMDKDLPLLTKEVERLREAGHDVRGEHVDVTDRGQLDQAFERTATQYGRLDVVFVNAGIDAGPGFMTTEGSRYEPGSLENVRPDHWDKVIAVNLTAAFSTLQAATRWMKRFGQGGCIIVTTSNAAIINESIVGTPYMPAKAGLAHLVRHAALELAQYGIRVNAIAPGAFQTNIAGGRLKIPADRKAFEQRSLQHRVPTTEEIKGLALFLASPAAAYMTGSTVVIDGGTALGRLD